MKDIQKIIIDWIGKPLLSEIRIKEFDDVWNLNDKLELFFEFSLRKEIISIYLKDPTEVVGLRNFLSQLDQEIKEDHYGFNYNEAARRVINMFKESLELNL